MLINFFLHMKEHRLPVSTTEYLSLLEALKAGLANCNLADFYTLSRLCLIKNEAHYDRFDVAFGEYFRNTNDKKNFGIDERIEDWIHSAAGNVLSEEDILMLDIPVHDLPREETRTLEEEQPEEEHQEKLVGGGGNNPMGEGGIHDEGLRMEGRSLGNRSAIKAWDSRDFTGLNDEIELNTRSIKIALRRLRKFAREGVPDELDLDDTIRSTARNAGWLDLKMRPERRNAVKVLLLFDIRGSMDVHIKLCEELFSAAKAEFKQLEWFYFHNVLGDSVWRYNGSHVATHYPLSYLMNHFGKDHKLIIVGDASMSLFELQVAPDSGDNQNIIHESGEVWIRRLLAHYKHAVWLNPEPAHYWHLTQTIQMLRDIMEQRMYPLTLAGLEQAMKALAK
jgi:uncharacterized protein